MDSVYYSTNDIILLKRFDYCWIFHASEELERSEQSLRILYVSPFFPPIIGGVESVLETTCRALAKSGHDVKVLTSPIISGSFNRLENYYIERSHLLDVPESGFIPPSTFDFDEVSDFFSNVLRDFTPDVIHFHNYQMRQYAMFLASFIHAAMNKYPMVDTIHNEIEDQFAQYVLSYFPLEAVVCVTRRSAIQLLQAGVPEKRVFTIPNLIDVERFKSGNRERFRSELGMKADDHLILFPSRIVGREGNLLLDSDRGKGLDVLIKAMPEILQRDPKAKLLLIGNDSVFPQKIIQAKKRLKEIVTKSTSKESLLFIEHEIPNSAIPDIFAASDIVVSLSATETFGMVFIEAMSAGRPVVGVNSNQNGVSEVVPDGMAGYLVPPDNAHATAKAISSILTNEEKRAMFSRYALKWVSEQFDTSVVLPRLVSLYENLAQASKNKLNSQSETSRVADNLHGTRAKGPAFTI